MIGMQGSTRRLIGSLDSIRLRFELIWKEGLHCPIGDDNGLRDDEDSVDDNEDDGSSECDGIYAEYDY